MLDMECFTYLNRALESPLSPYVVLASNRGICTIRGTEYDGITGGSGDGIRSPHGIPIDLLDRCMIVKTAIYGREEIRQVLETRIRVEGLSVKREALDRLADEGEKSSLRYALQLLTPASILAKTMGRNEVGVEDVGELGELFLDAKRSTGVLREMDAAERRF
jgi:RuvB-like protein 1 (pontin 52)